MPVVIGEIVTEVAVSPPPDAEQTGAQTLDPALIESIIRRATERALEALRREWDR